MSAHVKKLRLAGHEIKPEEEIDDNKLYTIKEAFPDFCPAKVLRGFRLTFEPTQAELAEKLGIKQSHVSDMERRQRPISRKMAAKLSKVFDISAKAFITV
jgi:antitoxin component HigA of HigAB toxin-antitoxin module